MRNGTVWVRLLRQRDTSRPWVVCLHGFGMGSSRMDINTLWANRLHAKVGYSVAVPVLPLHGRRNVFRVTNSLGVPGHQASNMAAACTDFLSTGL